MDEGRWCFNCARYRMDDSYCPVWKRKMLREQCCGNWKVKLADHYVPNAWDEWKRKAEKEQLKRKVK